MIWRSKVGHSGVARPLNYIEWYEHPHANPSDLANFTELLYLRYYRYV